MKATFVIFVKGALMGLADLVPGISGGTIALITGIYERFIGALSSLHINMLKDLLKGRFAKLWQRIDGRFLLPLGLGILASIFTMAHVVDWALSEHAESLRALFLGLLLPSVYVLWQQLKHTKASVLLLVVGFLFAAGLSFLTPMQLTNPSAVYIVVGSAIAISAMILPGISGGFLLLLLGLYPEVIAAVKNLDVTTLSLVALGCILGILSFSRLLHWLLDHKRNLTMAVLLGFILGAIIKLWPWQLPSEDALLVVWPSFNQVLLPIVFGMIGLAASLLLIWLSDSGVE